MILDSADVLQHVPVVDVSTGEMDDLDDKEEDALGVVMILGPANVPHLALSIVKL